MATETPVMKQIFLAGQEQELFNALPAKLIEGWVVETERVTFTDDEDQRSARMRNLSPSHPELIALKKQALDERFTLEQVAVLAQKIDLSSLSPEDLKELSFAWGPDIFTAMISAILRNVRSSEDIHDLSQLAGIRHGLLLALTRPLA